MKKRKARRELLRWADTLLWILRSGNVVGLWQERYEGYCEGDPARSLSEAMARCMEAIDVLSEDGEERGER